MSGFKEEIRLMAGSSIIPMRRLNLSELIHGINMSTHKLTRGAIFFIIDLKREASGRRNKPLVCFFAMLHQSRVTSAGPLAAILFFPEGI